jgi:hypothetical protein
LPCSRTSRGESGRGSVKRAVERGAEFYLERELRRDCYYDLLVGLDFMTALGSGRDRRLGFALNLLKERRRPDGPPIPFALERVGEPSKMITLRALKVLRVVDGA